MPEDRDKLCRRCGRCCQQSVRQPDGTARATPGTYCEFFDHVSRLCTCYSQRHQFKPECLNIDQAIVKGVLPEDCPYVANLRGYRCIVKGRDDLHNNGAGEKRAKAVHALGCNTHSPDPKKRRARRRRITKAEKEEQLRQWQDTFCDIIVDLLNGADNTTS